jgi:hypothetical protein
MPARSFSNERTCMDVSARAFFGYFSKRIRCAVMYPAFVRGTLTAGPDGLRVVGIPNHELVL